MQNIEKNNSQNQPETENEKLDEDTLMTNTSQSVHNDIIESLQETEAGYNARRKLEELFTQLLGIIKGEKNSITKVVSMYLCAFNVNGNAFKLEKMLYCKSEMANDDGCNPGMKNQYEALRASLEEGDCFTDEDIKRLPQLDKQKELMELLIRRLSEKINNLRKPVKQKYLEECFQAIVLLGRSPEFDDFPEFKKGPLSQFFKNNRIAIDEVRKYFEVLRKG